MSEASSEDAPPTVMDNGAIREHARRLVAKVAGDRSRRHVLGIAGRPGSGKSTLAARLAEAVDAMAPGVVVLLPMDGFHLTNAELAARHLRQRKGAPQTFDAGGLVRLIRQSRDRHRAPRFPLYDRQRHEPVWRDTAAQRVSPEAGLIITEGNYLLLTEMPWSQLAGLLDETWWLDTPAWQARRWAIARHCRGGRTRDDAERHYERSDRLNAILVERSRRRPDRVVRLPAAPNR